MFQIYRVASIEAIYSARSCDVKAKLSRDTVGAAQTAPMRVSELVSKCELDDAGVHRGCGDQAEVWIVHTQACASNGARHRELRVIEGIEEFGPELHALPLADPSHLRHGNIGIGLAGTADNSNTGCAPSRGESVIPNHRRCAEDSGACSAWLEEARQRRIGDAAQPVLHLPSRRDLIVRDSRAERGRTYAFFGVVCRGADKRCSATPILQRERIAGLE